LTLAVGLATCLHDAAVLRVHRRPSHGTSVFTIYVLVKVLLLVDEKELLLT
jgi:hypothetical protein